MAKSRAQKRKEKKNAGRDFKPRVPGLSPTPKRERSGRMSRPDRYIDDLGTPELQRHLADEGPSDFIQRYAANKTLTQVEAEALENFRKIRALAGFSGPRGKTTLSNLLPHAGGAPPDDERIERALRQYGLCCNALLGNHVALQACLNVCDNRPPRDCYSLKIGAKVLAKVLMEGKALAA